VSDAVLSAWISGGLALAGVLTTVILPKILKQGRAIHAVREQVQNSHGTNLRDDLDQVLYGIGHITEQIADIRTDLAWERRERMDLAERLTGERPLA